MIYYIPFHPSDNDGLETSDGQDFYVSSGITDAFDINLYRNSAEVNRVDKSDYIVSVGTLTGALRSECSMIRPSITFQYDLVPDFNYVYIPSFNRYYFVVAITSVNKNIWRMELNCDVLMTYRNQIKNLRAVVGRQEFNFNPDLVDTDIPTENDPIVSVIDIPSTAFSTTDTEDGYYFALTVIGESPTVVGG